MDYVMIDPREFGKMEAKVEALTAEVAELNAKVDRLLEAVNQGRGGIMTMLSIGAAISAVIGWFSSHWFGSGS